MTSNRQTIRGNDNIQILGDNNLVNPTVILRRRALTHSFIHDLLDIVYSLPSSKDDSYSLQKPAQIRKKLRFNNAYRYMAVIDNHVDDYVRVDEVMKDYPNSEDIVKKLRDMFIAVADFDDEGTPCVGDGDAQLDRIKGNLYDTIVNDANFDAVNHPAEKIEQFCIALIAYGVSKCKILETPV